MWNKYLFTAIAGVAVLGTALGFAATHQKGVKKSPQKALLKDKTAKWAPDFISKGEFTNPLVAESSGLSISQIHSGVLWTLNDSNNPAIVYSSSPTGESISQISIPVPNVDWEELYCDSNKFLYIADTGNNDYVRGELQMYRFKEPDPKARVAVLDRQWNIKPPKNFNCEAFVIFDAHFYLFNKSESSPRVFRFPMDSRGVVTLEDVGPSNVKSPITAASISPDHKHLALLSMDGLRVYGMLETLEKTIRQTPKHFPILRKQVEGCAFVAEGVLVSTEAGQLILLPREKYARNSENVDSKQGLLEMTPDGLAPEMPPAAR